MIVKRAMTLTLSDSEMNVLDELATKKDMSKTAIIRQAIRLYHLLDAKLAEGSKLLIEDSESKAKSEIMVL